MFCSNAPLYILQGLVESGIDAVFPSRFFLSAVSVVHVRCSCSSLLGEEHAVCCSTTSNSLLAGETLAESTQIAYFRFQIKNTEFAFIFSHFRSGWRHLSSACSFSDQSSVTRVDTAASQGWQPLLALSLSAGMTSQYMKLKLDLLLKEKMLPSCINSYYMQLWILFRTLHGLLVPCS
ncbi:hypothetical protein SLA2020_094030 [Shorea laevis]